VKGYFLLHLPNIGLVWKSTVLAVLFLAFLRSLKGLHQARVDHAVAVARPT
jgi:hypothetical protein